MVLQVLERGSEEPDPFSASELKTSLTVLKDDTRLGLFSATIRQDPMSDL